MYSFNQTIGRNVGKFMAEVAFPIRVEKAVGDDSQLYTTKNVVIREDKEEPLGLISHKRTPIPHKEITSWVHKEFEKSGSDYKLLDYSIDSRGDVYQEYLFDKPITTPDGEPMSPLVIVKQSYIGTPLEMHMGTYRFVCKNGIMVGKTIESIKIKQNELDGFLQSSIQAELGCRFNRFAEVANLYKKMDQEPFDPVLTMLLLSETIPTMMKKVALQLMHDQGVINLLTEEKLKSHDFETETAVKALYKVIKEDLTAYYLYNIFTGIATHRARSATARMYQYRAISENFQI